MLLYLPTQIRFLIGGECVTCHWSNSHVSGRAPLKRRQICTPADVKQIIFICVLFYFELGGITKHLMTGPSETVSFVSPRPQCFPRLRLQGTLRVNSLFPLGPVIKCLLSQLCNKSTSSHILTRAERDNMYLLTEWEGRTGKYLARGHGVRTERHDRGPNILPSGPT